MNDDENTATLWARWAVQHSIVCDIRTALPQMNVEELGEVLEHLHRRREYVEAQIAEMQRELGFNADYICDVERRQAGHSESAARFGQCVCEWCRTGSTPATGLKS